MPLTKLFIKYTTVKWAIVAYWTDSRTKLGFSCYEHAEWWSYGNIKEKCCIITLSLDTTGYSSESIELEYASSCANRDSQSVDPIRKIMDIDNYD